MISKISGTTATMILIAAWCTEAWSADVSQSTASKVVSGRGPALALATEAAQAALAACAGKNQLVSVSVVDSSGILRALLATEGASLMAVTSSTQKAVTANTFKIKTSQLGSDVKTDPVLAAKVASDKQYVTWAGGVPIRVGDELIGAIGVGGARDSNDDEACALTGLAQVQTRLK